jgi:hypothetical protein
MAFLQDLFWKPLDTLNLELLPMRDLFFTRPDRIKAPE